ncbi:MAG: hypothetical protein QOD11_501 [Bradyrhizobium sp.]|nr:hypothetical protein [Bradyrhizobium sp.]
MRFVREADDAGHRDIDVTDGVAEPERGAAPGAVGLRATGRINRRSNKLPPGKVTALYPERPYPRTSARRVIPTAVLQSAVRGRLSEDSTPNCQ